MKMTMKIDAELLKRVMEDYECVTEAEAVNMALREMGGSKRFPEFTEPRWVRHFVKNTVAIDEAPLRRVMGNCDSRSEAEAVDTALLEMNRRMRFRELGKMGLGMTPEELKDAVDPNYDLHALRMADLPRNYGK